MTVKPDIPAALLQNLEDVSGFDRQAFLAAHDSPAVVSIRLHPVKNQDVLDNTSPVDWCEAGRYLPERPLFTLDPSFHAGAYYVQEASSMFLDHAFRHVLPNRDNVRVLDLCAAPGGKSTLLAAALGENSLLIANEVIRTRASILEENISRWGYMNSWVTSNDARDFGRVTGYFDAIVVDAPCSGSGLFRKDPAAINEWSEGNVALCSERQQRILADVWDALKPEGVLIYATCSYSQAEDEDVLDWVATTYDVEGLSIPVKKEWGIVETVSPRKNIAGYRFFPHLANGEGFFLAAFRKNDALQTLKQGKFKSSHDKIAAQQAMHLLKSQELSIIKDNNGFSAMLPEHEKDLQLLKQYVYLRKAGLHIGSPSAKEWLPSHDLALSIDKGNNLPSIVLEKQEALRFLKKEDFGDVSASLGWNMITYNGNALGWVKNLGKRFNNYLPKNWRIRMDLPE